MRSHLLIAARAANGAADVCFRVGVLQIFCFPPSTPSEKSWGGGGGVLAAYLVMLHVCVGHLWHIARKGAPPSLLRHGRYQKMTFISIYCDIKSPTGRTAARKEKPLVSSWAVRSLGT